MNVNSSISSMTKICCFKQNVFFDGVVGSYELSLSSFWSYFDLNENEI